MHKTEAAKCVKTRNPARLKARRAKTGTSEVDSTSRKVAEGAATQGNPVPGIGQVIELGKGLEVAASTLAINGLSDTYPLVFGGDQ